MGKISYEKPPLNEVTFGLHFPSLAGLRAGHYGLLWARLRPDFIEALDKPVVGAPDSILAAAEWFPLPRVWYVHRNREHLLQLQPNRFYFNWRRAENTTTYPRFENLEPIFQAYVKKLGEFVTQESLGPLEISGLELSYTNHIYRGEGWNDIGDIGEIFPDLKWRGGARPQGRPKGFAWHGTFEHSNMRIDADIKTAVIATDPKRDVLVFEIRATQTAQPIPATGWQQWFTEANALIVDTFEDLTASKVQAEVWKRVSS